MITISITPEEITVTGHAGAGPPGQDIICAAVSALLQTLVASLTELTEDTITYDISPGHAGLEYEDLSEAGQLLIESYFIGIRGIAEAAPEHVTIKDLGRRGTEAQGCADKATEWAGMPGKENI